MNRFAVIMTTVAWLAATSADAQTLVIRRDAMTPGSTASAENFTGRVRIEPLFTAVDPSHASGGAVTFEAGARTAWHSHPRGQTLVVTAGTARVQRWDGPIEEARTGDVVRIPANVKHWHGASPGAAMTHIAITEHRDGTVVQWMEAVSEEQYNSALSAATPEVQVPANQQGGGRPSGPLQQRLSPGLAALTDEVLYGDVWIRPELSPRDRSLVTVSTLIATGKTAQLAGHLGRAFANGVQPSEASGLLAHLAIYSGWPNAVSALDVYEQVYTARRVDTSALRAVGERLAAPASEADRATAITDELGTVAPKFTELTNDVVFGDLWRRPDLTLRDRSLVTIAALAAMGDDDQLDLYLRRGIESGLTRVEIAEALTQLGFYAGWPKAHKAIVAAGRSLGQ